MATYIDELAEIEKQGKTAMRLREGVPGAQAGADDLRVRLNGGNPAVGNALRAAPPTDYSEVGRRLDNAHPKPTTGEVLRGQPATDYSEARRLAKPPQTIAEAAKTPRNVPINPTTTTMADASRPYIQQAAQPATNPNVPRPGGSIEAQAWKDARKPAMAAAPASPIAQQGMASVTPAVPATTAPKASQLLTKGAKVGGAVGAALGGLDVLKVANDPNSTKADVVVQGIESAVKVGGTALGGTALAPLGPVGVVGGGYAGNRIVDEGIQALRKSLGLGPSPVDRINNQAQATQAAANVQPGANGSTVLDNKDGTMQLASRPTNEPPQTIAATAAAAPPAAAQPTQRMGAPRTIAQAAQPAAKPAVVPGQDGVVEIIRMADGGERTYAMPGPSGAYSEVDAGYVDKGGSLEALGKAQVQAGLNAADPLAAKTASDIAVERVKNEGTANVAQIGANAKAAQLAAKPMPPAALKMQQESLDAIGTAGGMNADLAAMQKQIEDKKLKLGPMGNLANKALNWSGMSTEESRNFASFKSSMEKLRNDSLRLNKGVQTEGDSVRAWNELFENINDTDLVKQRMNEISSINNRATQLRRLDIDLVRSNYGLPPLDVEAYAKQPAALNKGDKGDKKAGGVPDSAVTLLKSNPALRKQFEAKYGVSADTYLGK